MNYMPHLPANGPDVESLIAGLHSDDGLVRRRARQALVEMGRASVPALVDELDSYNEHARWESAKALCEIHTPRAAPALVERLEDDNFSVRWLAAEALIGLGKDALGPLFEALERRPASEWLRRGAHHVLSTLAKDAELCYQVQPVLDALNDVEPTLCIPPAAEEARKQLQAVG